MTEQFVYILEKIYDGGNGRQIQEVNSRKEIIIEKFLQKQELNQVVCLQVWTLNGRYVMETSNLAGNISKNTIEEFIKKYVK